MDILYFIWYLLHPAGTFNFFNRIIAWETCMQIREQQLELDMEQQTGSKGVRQSCILSPCLFNFDAECIMRNAGLEEAQAGIKIARRNINKLRYADDTTLMV